MKKVTYELTGADKLSWSRYHGIPLKERESHADHEKRTWREKFYYNNDGNVIIPAMAFKATLKEIASYLSIKIKGHGQKTYSAKFKAGILVNENPIVYLNGKPIHRDNVQCEVLFLPSDGKAGSGKRVEKTFPIIEEGWVCTPEIYIMDEIITEDILTQHFEEAGKFTGLGRFRPGVGGIYGRFSVKKI